MVELQDLVVKLAALVSAPRVRLARYHRIFAPAAAWRPLIVPSVNVDSAAVTYKSRFVNQTKQRPHPLPELSVPSFHLRAIIRGF